MEDVQSRIDTRKIAINQVGIKGIKHPIAVGERNGSPQHTVAEFSMYVGLPDNVKGTHMSRFLEILNQQNYEMTVSSFRNMLQEVSDRLGADNGTVEMKFPFFVNKTAPESKIKSLMDYEVSFLGVVNRDKIDVRLKVLVAATSLCPCSKKISDYGAHNQRSHITVEILINDFIWIEDVIDLVEAEASCELYSILKRTDEKVVTERAYDNPKFVEDLVRDVAVALRSDKRVLEYIVEAENFESIHNHSAYARIDSVI